jgi:hypothetical protein
VQPAPVVAYFDSNIYGDLAKDTKARESIEGAIQSEKVRLVTSVFNIEEPLYLAKGRPDKFWEIARCWKDLTAKERVILDSGKLMDKEVDSILRRNELNLEEKMLDLTVALCYQRLEEAFAEGSLEDVEFVRVIQSTRERLGDFHQQMIEGRERAGKLKAKNPDWNPSLEQYYASVEKSSARSLIERLGYKWELTDALVDQMLKARSLKLGVRAGVYLIHRYAAVGAKPALGDSRDMHHAIASSVACVFVTNDKKLASGIRGVTLSDYEVVNLSEFLERL